jgi:hypothetical protein
METMFKKFEFTLSAAPMLSNAAFASSQPASASGNAEQTPGTNLAIKAQRASSFPVLTSQCS